MATPNRAALITNTLKVLSKHFKPSLPAKERSLFEHLMYACLLENSPTEAADEVFKTLSTGYYDWNEVRVSSLKELAEVMKSLNDPEDAARRLKNVLHSIFEMFYSFDLELMKKQNLGVSVKQFEKFKSITPFVISYAIQASLGGHSIPLSKGLILAMQSLGAITAAEAKKHSVPGLERSIPKTSGLEQGSLLHQLGVDLYRSPYGTNTRKLLLKINPNCKETLPKRPAPPKPEPKPAAKPATKTEPKPAKKKPAASSAAPKETSKKITTKKPAVKKSPIKKAPKKVAKAVVKKKMAKKTTSAKKKITTKKPAIKKSAVKKSPKKVAKAVVKKKMAKKTTSAKKKVTTKKPAVKKSPVKKAPKKVAKAVVKKKMAKKTTSKKSPVKKTSKRKPR